MCKRFLFLIIFFNIVVTLVGAAPHTRGVPSKSISDPVAGAAKNYFVKAQVDQETVNLGDSLVYTVEVMTAGEIQYSPDVILPNFGRNFQVNDIFTRSSINILNGKTYIINFKEVHLLSRKAGSITIPVSKVELIDPDTQHRIMEETNPITLTVKSTTGKKAAATPTPEIDILRPIKKKARLSVTQWLPFAIAGVIIFTIIGVMIYLRYRPQPKEKTPEEPVDTRTPEQRAFDELEEAVKLKEAGEINKYYTVLSAVLRQYLSEEYKIDAQESTTKEVIHEMKVNRFKELFMNHYKDYAIACDEVKFAGKIPITAEIEKAFPEVKSMIMEKEAQEPLLEPEPEHDSGDEKKEDTAESPEPGK